MINTIQKPSKQDQIAIKKIRANILMFLKEISDKYDNKNCIILDIAPQIYAGASGVFKKAKIETLDIDATSRATYIADITKNNQKIIENDKFDIVICTEVLEHTLNPFMATEELYRITKPNGMVFATTPFNFRIHGPLPDCWRFTEHGLKQLFTIFSQVTVNELPTPDRPLMPLHYQISARK